MSFKRFYKKNKEVILYFTYGILTTLVSLLSYSLAVDFIGITGASALSWIAAVLFAFVTNKLFVFGTRGRGFVVLLREFLIFFGVRALTGILDVILPEVLYNIGLDFPLFGVTGMVAKLTVSVLVIILNYLFSKFLVFKKSR